MIVGQLNELFTYCLRAFTQQDPKMILQNEPIFFEENKSFRVNYNHPAIQNLPNVFSSDFNILVIIAEHFLKLYREDYLPQDKNRIVAALTQYVDGQIQEMLESILPSLNPGVISAVAREKYEHSDNEGFYAGFITEDTADVKEQIPGLLHIFNVDGEFLGYDTIHGHRKLLNLSGRKDPRYCLIYQRDVEKFNGYRVLGIAKLSDVAGIVPMIHFISHAIWEIYLPSKSAGTGRMQCCAVFRDGHHCLPKMDTSEGERRLLGEKLGKHLESFPGIDPVETTYTVLQRAKQQPKGALIIFADEVLMDNLCDRFCRNQNAIDMRRNEPLVDLRLEPEALDRFSSIDGAVMVDFSGKVQAIGCILDGTVAKGSVARGSRYNGTVGFLHQEGTRRGRPFLLALVVSEDGIVDVITSDEVKAN